MNSYDLHINVADDWARLSEKDLHVIVDPFIYRVGQVFLDGAPNDAWSTDNRWKIIDSDIGALASFLDLIILNERVPAFNYSGTFDKHLTFDQSLGALVNRDRNERKIVSVNVSDSAYDQTKQAVLAQLKDRMAHGQLVSPATGQDILSSLSELEYKWEPRLEGLESTLQDDNDFTREQKIGLARFFLGSLLFSGYSQQADVPHVLAPRRSRFISAAGVHASRANNEAEARIYQRIRDVVRGAGGGWRDRTLPWTPSFLPYLLEEVGPRDGPDALLNRAKELANRISVQNYRNLRRGLLSRYYDDNVEARRELEGMADDIAQELGMGRNQLELAEHFFVEILPEAFLKGTGEAVRSAAFAGAVAGASAGATTGGPLGAAAGALAGAVAGNALKSVHKKLWGWVIDQVPFYSARKLLSRSVQAEIKSREELGRKLWNVWITVPVRSR